MSATSGCPMWDDTRASPSSAAWAAVAQRGKNERGQEMAGAAEHKFDEFEASASLTALAVHSLVILPY
jgi:uncharacterized protein YecA (UPF0149 family)